MPSNFNIKLLWLTLTWDVFKSKEGTKEVIYKYD